MRLGFVRCANGGYFCVRMDSDLLTLSTKLMLPSTTDWHELVTFALASIAKLIESKQDEMRDAVAQFLELIDRNKST